MTGGGSLILASSTGFSLTTVIAAASRRDVGLFLIVGRTRLAVFEPAGTSLTTGLGVGGSGCGTVTVFSTFGDSTFGGGSDGGRSCASELLNTSAPKAQQTITTNVAIASSVRNLLLD